MPEDKSREQRGAEPLLQMSIPDVSGTPKTGLLCSGRELNLRIRRLLSPDKLTYIVSGRSYNPQLSYD